MEGKMPAWYEPGLRHVWLPYAQMKTMRHPLTVARTEGCDVKVYPEAPPVVIDNIGPVTATCGLDVSDQDCLRTLQDQACKLGGDVAWGVEPVCLRPLIIQWIVEELTDSRYRTPCHYAANFHLINVLRA